MTVQNQKGGALIFVSIIGMVLSIGFTLFMNSTVLVESRAVEAELARTRVYWAEMGMFNYALSRISNSKLCGSNCGNDNDTVIVPVLQAYFNELSGSNTWAYRDEASAYSFTTAVAAVVDEDPTRNAQSGWLKATSSYTPSALLASSAQKLPQMELRLCIGLGNAGAKCGDIDHANGGKRTEFFSVNRLTDLPSP